MKTLFKGTLALIIMVIAFQFANTFILSVLDVVIKKDIIMDFFKHLLDAMLSSAWLVFLTFLLPFNIKKTTRWITGILASIYAIMLILAIVFEMKASILIETILHSVFLVVYFKVSNVYNILKKVDEDGKSIVNIARQHFILGTAIFTLVFALLYSMGIVFSVAVSSLLAKLPVWTILLILPVFEGFLHSLIRLGTSRLGHYLEHRFPVFPAVSRIIRIHAVISTVIIFVVFVFIISEGEGFWRGCANIAIGLLAFRIFNNLVFPYIDTLSSKYQKHLANGSVEFTFDECTYQISNEQLIVKAHSDEKPEI